MSAGVDELAVLQLLRVRGMVPRAAVEAVGPPDALIDSGLVASREARGEQYLTLSEAGRQVHADALAELRRAPAFEALERAYDRDFLPLNAHFKDLASQWQLADDRWPLLEELIDVDERIAAFLDLAHALSPHFDRYRTGLRAAMDAVQDGDVDALTAAVGPSYHNLWFELHEDLLAVLGRSRADEDSQ